MTLLHVHVVCVVFLCTISIEYHTIEHTLPVLESSIIARDHFGLVEREGSRGRAKKLTGPKVKGELTADALPPLVERLSLELPEGCTLSVCGKVSSVVEDLSECYRRVRRRRRGEGRGGEGAVFSSRCLVSLHDFNMEWPCRI